MEIQVSPQTARLRLPFSICDTQNLMPGFAPIKAAPLFVLLLLAMPLDVSQAESSSRTPQVLLPGEVLHYRVEWRLIRAGSATLSWNPYTSSDEGSWQTDLHLESAGLVSKLYKVDDNYLALLNDALCMTTSTLTASEGGRRRETTVEVDPERGKASYLERDLNKNTVIKSQETEVPTCVYDVIGGLYRLRTMRLEPGTSTQLPVSNGKKSVMARVDAEQREDLETPAGVFHTIRHQAFLFNDVLYRRKGRLYIWITDDERRLPVQIRVRLQFHIGTITLQLEKVEVT
jgi:hypothetical protein